jgi:hypothetical protein
VRLHQSIGWVPAAFECFECEHVTWGDITGVVRLINQSSIFLMRSPPHRPSNKSRMLGHVCYAHHVCNLFFSFIRFFNVLCTFLIPARPNLSSLFKVCLMLCEILYVHIFIGAFVCVCVHTHTDLCAQPNLDYLASDRP